MIAVQNAQRLAGSEKVVSSKWTNPGLLGLARGSWLQCWATNAFAHLKQTRENVQKKAN